MNIFCSYVKSSVVLICLFFGFSLFVTSCQSKTNSLIGQSYLGDGYKNLEGLNQYEYYGGYLINGDITTVLPKTYGLTILKKQQTWLIILKELEYKNSPHPTHHILDTLSINLPKNMCIKTSCYDNPFVHKMPDMVIGCIPSDEFEDVRMTQGWKIDTKSEKIIPLTKEESAKFFCNGGIEDN
jgi:hypothetical protein